MSYAYDLNDDLAFVANADAETLRGPSWFASSLLITIVAFFFIALIWMAFAKLDEVTAGQGKVIPSGKVQTVQNLEGGIVTDILVREGEIVELGEPLLHLDDLQFSAKLKETKAAYWGQLAAVARLEAEANGISEPTFPEELLSANPELAEAENALFISRAEKIDADLRTFTEQQNQRASELKDLQQQAINLRKSLKLIREEVRITEPLVERGISSNVEFLRLKREAQDILGKLDTAKLSIPRLSAAIEEVKSKQDSLRKEFRSQAAGELQQAQVKLSGLREALSAMQDRVARTAVRSPVKGTIKSLMVNTIGGVVQPGMKLIEIVPLEEQLLIEAQIQPQDIAFLHPGQNVKVRFTAYDATIYGGLDASLEHIGADTVTDENGRSFYNVQVRTERNYLGDAKDPLPIIPGMVADVNIITGQKTVLDYLLKPINKARQKALRER